MPKLPVGTFVANKLAEGKKLVSKSKNSAGYAALIVEAARSVVGEYPTLSVAERASVFATLKHEADTQNKATGQYPTIALQEASRIWAFPAQERSRQHDNLQNCGF